MDKDRYSFARWLKDHTKKKSIKPSELAGKANISRAAAYAYMSTSPSGLLPDHGMLVRLLKSLGLPADCKDAWEAWKESHMVAGIQEAA